MKKELRKGDTFVSKKSKKTKTKNPLPKISHITQRATGLFIPPPKNKLFKYI